MCLLARSFRRALNWSRRWGAMISVSGGLIIFLSWVADRGFREDYARVKAAVENASRDHKMLMTLLSIRQEMRVLNTSPPPPIPLTRGMPVVLPPRKLSVEEARSLHHFGQLDIVLFVDHRDGMNALKSLSESVPFPSPAGGTINAEAARAAAVVDDLQRQGLSAVNAITRADQTKQPADLDTAIDLVVKYLDAITSYLNGPPFVQAEWLWRAEDVRMQEAEAEIERLKNRQETSRSVVLVLYVVGTILVLFGQFLDKTKPAAPPAPAPRRSVRNPGGVR